MTFRVFYNPKIWKSGNLEKTLDAFERNVLAEGFRSMAAPCSHPRRGEGLQKPEGG